MRLSRCANCPGATICKGERLLVTSGASDFAVNGKSLVVEKMPAQLRHRPELGGQYEYGDKHYRITELG